MKKSKNNRNTRGDYSQLKKKLIIRLLSVIFLAFLGVSAFYQLIWRRRGGEFVVSVLLESILKIDRERALDIYQQVFRNHLDFIWITAIAVLFLILLRIVLTWFTKYFDSINQGIYSLLEENQEIRLPSEMQETERKLNAVKDALRRRSLKTELAEQQKNQLVLDMAHDIRTPLTSVIGYLNLLDEAPDMPLEQRIKYTKIALDKAYRLEKLVSEFFEITRYHFQQIQLEKESIDLYYMLVQLVDEFYPILSQKNHKAVLYADENLTIWGDSVKLARVFNNILKNAAAYSFPNSEIRIFAEERENQVMITFENQGPEIPAEKLSQIFDRFYRLDEARSSNAGGAGLGLAIAKEIVMLHHGKITAESIANTVRFVVTLPISDS